MLLVAEILHRFVVDQRVDRARVRPRILLVHLPAILGAPLGDRDRVADVADQRHRRNQREPDLVLHEQDARDQGDFHQGGEDIVDGVAEQVGNRAAAAFDVARYPAGLPRQVEAQRKRVQVAEHLQGHAAHRAVLHLCEYELAQFGEERGREPQHAVPGEQQERHRDQGTLHRKPVDDFLHHQGHADIGELAGHQKREGEQHPSPELPQVGKQESERVPLAALARLRGTRRHRGGNRRVVTMHGCSLTGRRPGAGPHRHRCRYGVIMWRPRT